MRLTTPEHTGVIGSHCASAHVHMHPAQVSQHQSLHCDTNKCLDVSFSISYSLRASFRHMGSWC